MAQQAMDALESQAVRRARYWLTLSFVFNAIKAVPV
jgi:hypothetical protein